MFNCNRQMFPLFNIQCLFVIEQQASNQMIIKLEEENSALMMQLQALIGQNQDLLTKLLNSKDQIVEEQKSYVYVCQLHNLCIYQVTLVPCD